MEYFSQRKNEKYWNYGVHDLLVTEGATGFHDLYASFGVDSTKAGCPVTRIAVAEAFDRTTPLIEWRTLYETHPCMPLGPGANQSAGGRLQFRDGYLYATIGSHQADVQMLRIGDPARTFPQTNDNSYGKIIRINVHSGAVETLSIGHRVPQGLYIDASARIWSTEHGPFGGDELNLIESGANYGFPFVTYGGDYDLQFWPMSTRQNRHEGFAKPIFAWLPSVGISDLIGLEDEGFGPWRGDLLAGSLKGETLYRLRIEEGRVIFSEPISIGHRIRDIAIYESTILLSTDDNLLIRIRLKPRVSPSK
jgi:glucose/arabinose dehydrogenase